MNDKPLTLEDMDLSIGKRARLHRLLYEHGPGNGTMLLLPIDQGLEHGPRDFFPNSPSEDPEFQCKLAEEGGYSGIVFHIGLAEKYMSKYAGKVPLVLKINGKTNIPSDAEALSTMTGTVEDAVRLGADAVGYTLYVGSPSQPADIEQFMMVRAEAERLGMPVIMWAYPRGKAIEKKGGTTSLYAVEYAARVACELGADVVKLNYPQIEPDRANEYPAPYDELLDLDHERSVTRVVRAAGRTLVLISGGKMISDEDLLEKSEVSIRAGVTGFIFGRNMWQRPFDEALGMTKRIKERLLKARD